MEYISKFLDKLWMLLLLSCLTAARSHWSIRKPTNSVSIRQSSLGLCRNQASGSFVEHPDDCRLFYLCQDNGDAVLASCPLNMFYNKLNKICDTAANAGCQNKTNQDIVIPPTNNEQNLNSMITDAAKYCATLTPQAGNDRIVYVGSSSSCSKYYICYYGQAILQECSEELHWNAVTAKCDLPERAKCTLEVNTLPVRPPSDITSELLHCPAYGQHLYPHMQRCEFFIYCVKGHATLQQCPFYYFFDVITKSCQWSRTALCVRDLNFPRH
ncbi:probable chitinase 10 [Drosophila mojavensis]|uniref:Chitin-binding type-2 domain-containing protein n=1 Tax=Drosophila mojavensis TaxID=7230 RepID=B4KUI9_DROMO|nr:probable chitinase 10 [Drosophila mojavensis]EDW18217.1 uncharacterized protein Dmoj_GI12221 [Drosophila mojavensis]